MKPPTVTLTFWAGGGGGGGGALTYPLGAGAGAARTAGAVRIREISPLSSLSCACSSSVWRSRFRILSASDAVCAVAVAGISSHALTACHQGLSAGHEYLLS